MTIAKLTFITADIPILIAGIFAVINYKSYPKSLQIFSLFLILSCCIQLSSTVLFLYRINNMPLLHLYTPLSVWFLIHFYREILKDFLSKNILKIAAFAFIAISSINSIFFQDIFDFNSISLTIQAIIMTVLSLATYSLYIQKVFYVKNIHFIKTLIWINSGIFIYFTSNLLLYYYSYYLVKADITRVDFMNTWMLHSLFSNVMYVCFLIGLWKYSKQKKYYL